MATPTTGPGTPGWWKVTGQVPATKVGPSGQLEDGMTVQFQTGTGVRGTVFVADSVYSPQQVAQLVAQKAAAIDGVGALSATSPPTGS